MKLTANHTFIVANKASVNFWAFVALKLLVLLQVRKILNFKTAEEVAS
jgi:hypothetical protein